MPSGKTHDRITWALFPAVVTGGYVLTQRWHLGGLAGISTLFAGLMFGPDLDIHSVQYRRWGYLRWLWLPYRRLFRHRSLWSHGLMVGTGLRLLYLGLFIGLGLGPLLAVVALAWPSLGMLLQQGLAKIFVALQQHPEELIALVLGLEIGAMGHTLSDVLVSRYRRQFRRKRKTHRPR
ncbi:metal-binding protein [Synechocystis sp. LKSZ1]|uniref:metal-binding protein n=1 Tax=Synechocystis sp. LKSZ1 TaxID=3144951 RepID=UPI00336BB436